MVRLSSWQRFLPVLIILLLTAVVLQARGWIEYVPSHVQLSDFPSRLGSWEGVPRYLTPGEQKVLGPGEFLLRDYFRSSSEPAVNLFIAYYPSQRSGDVIHSPQNCLPGSGWTPMQMERVPLSLPDGGKIIVNRAVIAQGLDRQLVYYWYQAHGRVTPSEYWAKIYLVTDAVRMNRTDGSMVRVVTPIPSDSSETAAENRAMAFINLVLPQLDRFIPR
jgi:EpsI family protein